MMSTDPIPHFDVDAFISDVEERPAIWDLKSDLYSDRGKKTEAWEELCLKFIPNFSEKNVAEKNKAGDTLNAIILLTLLAATAPAVDGDCRIREIFNENPCGGELSCDQDFNDAINNILSMPCLGLYDDYSMYSKEEDPFQHVHENFTITVKAEDFNEFRVNDSSVMAELDTRITAIAITNGRMKSVPKVISSLRRVTIVDMSSNKIESLNLAAFSGLRELTVLNMSNNNIVNLESLASLASLSLAPIDTIDLSHNSIQGVAQDCIPPYKTLRHLNLSYNHIETFHDSALANVTSLLTLDISNNRLVEMGSFLTRLVRLQELLLDHNNLQSINNNNFYNMSALKYLNVSSNALSNIENFSFNSLQALRQLDMSKNKITVLSKSMFQNNSLLSSFDVSFNNISKIESGAFEGAHIEDLVLHNNTISGSLDTDAFIGLYFEKLDLSDADISELGPNLFGPKPSFRSLNFSKNLITKISNTSFKNLVFLASLDLSYNKLDDVEFDMTDLRNLTYFFINNNYIKEIRKNMFKSLTAVKTLDLSNNAITNIEMLSFENLRELNSLNIKNNPLAEIPAQTFSGLTSCYSLDLSGSKIQKIQDNAFSGLNSLNALNLSYSNLNILEYNAFNGTGSIEFLDLSHNQIESFSTNNTNWKLLKIWLAWNNITSISKISFQMLRGVSLIDLSNNRISKIQPGSFYDCEVLGNLKLNNNDLSFLQFGVFEGLANIEIIDLSNNKFHRFDAKVLHGVSSIKTLYLDDNFIDEIDLNDFFIADIKKLSIGGNMLPCETLTELKYNSKLRLAAAARTPYYDTENIDGITCKSISESGNTTQISHGDAAPQESVYLQMLISLDTNRNRYLAAISAGLLSVTLLALAVFVYFKFRSKLTLSRTLSSSRQTLSNAIELE